MLNYYNATWRDFFFSFQQMITISKALCNKKKTCILLLFMWIEGKQNKTKQKNRMSRRWAADKEAGWWNSRLQAFNRPGPNESQIWARTAECGERCHLLSEVSEFSDSRHCCNIHRMLACGMVPGLRLYYIHQADFYLVRLSNILLRICPSLHVIGSPCLLRKPCMKCHVDFATCAVIAILVVSLWLAMRNSICFGAFMTPQRRQCVACKPDSHPCASVQMRIKHTRLCEHEQSSQLRMPHALLAYLPVSLENLQPKQVCADKCFLSDKARKMCSMEEL